MKKILLVILFCVLLLVSVSASTFAADSYFGYGVEVVANDVSIIKTGLVGKKLSFTKEDFSSGLCTDGFKSITVTAIPSSTVGTLYLGGRRVGVGRVIKTEKLDSLYFIPTKEATEARFSFTAEGYCGGAEVNCVMKFVEKVNYAPESEEAATLFTQESITVYGNLTAKDPEGDSLEFIAVTTPSKGILEIVDKSAGRYSYTPISGYVGEDSFVFVVRDEYGNYSEPREVRLKIGERMCQTVYADMEGREEYNGAIAMTAMGVMSGRLFGDDTYFMPEEGVSRAEFVAMALKSCNIAKDTTLTKTFFDDDSQINGALKGYVATAQRLGVISGDFKDGKLLFSPNETITRYEAAKIMSVLLGLPEGEEEVFTEYEGIPVYARASVSNMLTLGIFEDSDAENSSEGVTRADAAEYLYKLSSVK